MPADVLSENLLEFVKESLGKKQLVVRDIANMQINYESNTSNSMSSRNLQVVIEDTAKPIIIFNYCHIEVVLSVIAFIKNNNIKTEIGLSYCSVANNKAADALSQIATFSGNISVKSDNDKWLVSFDRSILKTNITFECNTDALILTPEIMHSILAIARAHEPKPLHLFLVGHAVSTWFTLNPPQAYERITDITLREALITADEVNSGNISQHFTAWFPNLRSVDLDFHLSPSLSIAIPNKLHEQILSVPQLKYYRCAIRNMDDAFIGLGHAIAKSQTIEGLIIEGTTSSITDEAFNVFARVVENNTTLRAINMGRNLPPKLDFIIQRNKWRSENPNAEVELTASINSVSLPAEENFKAFDKATGQYCVIMVDLGKLLQYHADPQVADRLYTLLGAKYQELIARLALCTNKAAVLSSAKFILQLLLGDYKIHQDSPLLIKVGPACIKLVIELSEQTEKLSGNSIYYDTYSNVTNNQIIQRLYIDAVARSSHNGELIERAIESFCSVKAEGDEDNLRDYILRYMELFVSTALKRAATLTNSDLYDLQPKVNLTPNMLNNQPITIVGRHLHDLQAKIFFLIGWCGKCQKHFSELASELLPLLIEYLQIVVRHIANNPLMLDRDRLTASRFNTLLMCETLLNKIKEFAGPSYKAEMAPLYLKIDQTLLMLFFAEEFNITVSFDLLTNSEINSTDSDEQKLIKGFNQAKNYAQFVEKVNAYLRSLNSVSAWWRRKLIANLNGRLPSWQKQAEYFKSAATISVEPIPTELKPAAKPEESKTDVNKRVEKPAAAGPDIIDKINLDPKDLEDEKADEEEKLAARNLAENKDAAQFNQLRAAALNLVQVAARSHSPLISRANRLPVELSEHESLVDNKLFAEQRPNKQQQP